MGQSGTEHTLFCGKGNENHELGRVYFVHKRIISAVQRVDIYEIRKKLRGF
jgi:hypothetical protein